MDLKNTFNQILVFLKEQSDENNDKFFRIFQLDSKRDDELKTTTINFGVNCYKNLVLEEDAGLELGGITNMSYSLIYPFPELNILSSDQLLLLGSDVKELKKKSIDICLLIFIQCRGFESSDMDVLRRYSFISNGIEGFMIRSIPKKFWCRVHKKTLDKGFSFKLFAYIITQLYKTAFPQLVEYVSVLIIHSNTRAISEFIPLTSELVYDLNRKWLSEVNSWEKKVDCNYEWECKSCPYFETCSQIKRVVEGQEGSRD